MKQCYECGVDNADQKFCGNCAAPLLLSDYISSKVKSQLTDSIRDRDVLETESSIKIFKQAWEWIRLIFGIAIALLVLAGGGIIWKASDFWYGVDKAKQSVSETAKQMSAEVTSTSAHAKEDVNKYRAAAEDVIQRALLDAVQQARSLRQATLQSKNDILRQTAALHRDIQGSRIQLQAAGQIQSEMEEMRKQLAQATHDIQAQQRVISSSEEFVKSVFSSHVTEAFSITVDTKNAITLDPNRRYAVVPPSDKKVAITVVWLLLKSTPIQRKSSIAAASRSSATELLLQLPQLDSFLLGRSRSRLTAEAIECVLFS